MPCQKPPWAMRKSPGRPNHKQGIPLVEDTSVECGARASYSCRSVPWSGTLRQAFYHHGCHRTERMCMRSKMPAQPCMVALASFSRCVALIRMEIRNSSTYRALMIEIVDLLSTERRVGTADSFVVSSSRRLGVEQTSTAAI